MSKKFKTFQELINWRSKCPICSKDLVYKITTSVYENDNRSSKTSVQAHTMEKYFDKLLNSGGPDVENVKGLNKVSFEYKPNKDSIIKFDKIDTILNILENKAYVKDFDITMGLFHISIVCNHDVFGAEYEAKGSFDLAIDYDIDDLSQIPVVDERMSFDIDNIVFDFERYKLGNVYLNDEVPGGNFITIINDFHINKTSFSMAEVNLDGTAGNWKEKRIDLVKDDFFKFSESEKIYSRINSIFLLK